MKIKTIQTLSNIETLEDLIKFVSIGFDDVVNTVNGNLGFDNMSVFMLDAAFAAPNAEITFEHKLGRVPAGYLVKGLTAALTVYDGATANTADKIYLKSSAAGTARLIIF